MLPPAVTVAGPVFTRKRSAEAVTRMTAVDVLLPRFGSGDGLETVALLVSDPAWAER